MALASDDGQFRLCALLTPPGSSSHFIHANVNQAVPAGAVAATGPFGDVGDWLDSRDLFLRFRSASRSRLVVSSALGYVCGSLGQSLDPRNYRRRSTLSPYGGSMTSYTPSSSPSMAPRTGDAKSDRQDADPTPWGACPPGGYLLRQSLCAGRVGARCDGLAEGFAAGRLVLLGRMH